MQKKLFTLVVLLALVLAACGGGDDEAGDGGSDDTVDTAPTVLDISMTDMAFSPTALSVAADADVTLNLENLGGFEHNFVVLSSPISAESEFSEDLVIFQAGLQPAETGSFTFSAPPAGTYQVICSVSGHFTAGMVAELVAS